MHRTQWLNTVKQHLQTVDIVVEIGVWRGDYSLQIINSLQPKQFYGVDPYKLYPGMVSAPGPEYSNQNNLDILAEQVKNKLANHNAVLHRMTSVESAELFKDNTVDFIYIDGDHTYEGVTQDLYAWWPKIKKGGVFSGDDYTTGTTGKGFAFGVIQAVEEFAKKHKYEYSVTTGSNPSWWLIK
jgi:hypothetical protein